MSLSSVSAREELLHLQSCCHRAEDQRLYIICHAIVMALHCAPAVKTCAQSQHCLLTAMDLSQKQHFVFET